MSAEELTITLPVKVAPLQKNFNDSWKFISDVKRTVDGAFTYKESRRGKFKTGRDRYIIDFYGEDAGLIQSHYAMKLISKTSGNDYTVCNVDCMDAIDVPSTIVVDVTSP